MALLRDRSLEFEEAGVHPFAISRDSPYTHIAWAQVIDPTFPLLSDWNGEAVEAFGIAHDYRGLRGVARRSGWLIDGEGTIRGVWEYGSSEVPDMDELLRAARALGA